MSLVVFFLIGCIVSVFSEDISATYKCDFEDGDCGIINVPGSTLLWERKSMNLGDRDGYVLALQSSTGQTQSSTVMSPRFELNLTMPGCITFDLYISGYGMLFLQMEHGAGMNKFRVIAGDTNGWRSVSTDVYILDFITFYCQGKINPSAGSKIIALDNVVFELNKC